MSKTFKKIGGLLTNPATALSNLGLGVSIKGLTKVPGVRKPEPVVELPDEMEVTRKRRNAAARKRRQGRMSTVMSDFGY